MIIGITGTLASGKGSVVDILKEKGFKHYSVREFLTKELKKINLEINRDNLVMIGNKLREENSPSYIAEELYEEARKEGGNCVIESLRAPGEVISLKKKGSFYLIAVDANVKLRYIRASSRMSETDKISFDDFISQEMREIYSEDPTKQNIGRCIEMADFIIQNNGSLSDLHDKVNRIIKEMPGKREDYISWDDYFMGVSVLSGKRSKDPSTQVGACIVNPDKRIVGVGYNGFPKGCPDEKFPWSREGAPLDTKYLYVVHAELNAILNSIGENLKNCTMYIALFPCNECAKAIIQAGIKKISYLSDKYAETDSVIAAKKMFDSAEVKYEQLIPKNKEINLKLTA